MEWCCSAPPDLPRGGFLPGEPLKCVGDSGSVRVEHRDDHGGEVEVTRWAARTTFASTCWVSAQRRVRLPPQTLVECRRAECPARRGGKGPEPMGDRANGGPRPIASRSRHGAPRVRCLQLLPIRPGRGFDEFPAVFTFLWDPSAQLGESHGGGWAVSALHRRAAPDLSGSPARRDADAQLRPQQLRDPHQRHAQLRVHPHDQAVTDAAVEAPYDGTHHRECFLILRRHTDHHHLAAAVGTRGGRRRPVGLVNLRRTPAAGVPARTPAATLWSVLGEGSRLSQPCPPRGVKLLLEVFASPLPSVPVALNPRQLLAQPFDAGIAGILLGRSTLPWHGTVMPQPRKSYKYKLMDLLGAEGPPAKRRPWVLQRLGRCRLGPRQDGRIDAATREYRVAKHRPPRFRGELRDDT